MRKIHKKMQALFNEARSILITSHIDPDGDSLGSMLAMYNYLISLGKKAVIVNEGNIPQKYRHLPGIEKVCVIRDSAKKEHYDLAVVLECSTLERTGYVRNIIDDNLCLINIDHHPDNTGYGRIAYINEKAAAVAEMLTEFFNDIEFEIDPDTATALYAAILTDTGRFRYSSTTKKTMEIAGHLIEKGAEPRAICDNIYYSLSENVIKVTGMLLSNMELHENGRICLMSLTRAMLDGKNGNIDTEGMAEYTLYSRDAMVGGFLREIEAGATKVSLRSRNNIDVSELAHKFGGGGHVNASGFIINQPIKAARLRLLEELRKVVNGAV